MGLTETAGLPIYRNDMLAPAFFMVIIFRKSEKISRDKVRSYLPRHNKIERRMTMKTKLLAGVTIGLLMHGMIGMASAAILNVDFGLACSIYTGLGAAPDLATSTKWNGLSNLGGSNLLYSDGTQATGIIVSTTASQIYNDGGNLLVGDRIFVAGSWTKFDVTISGLSDSSKYDLYAYGSNKNFASTYTVGSVSDYAIGYNNSYPFLLHNNYALLSQISPTSGQIKIVVDRYNPTPNFSAAAVIGGFQLQEFAPVPAPSTILLLAPTLVGLALWRRKHS